MEIARGQRVKLQDLGLAGKPFALEVKLAGGGMTLDVACFGLDAHRRLSDERYMTFFNQPATPCGGVRTRGDRGFVFDLDRLPAAVDALVVTVAIDGAGTMARLGASTAQISSDSDFPFLEKLDELSGRLIDNANYFAVARPDEHSDDALYDLLMAEYPAWVKLARARSMFR